MSHSLMDPPRVSGRRSSGSVRDLGWVHVCNGMDPARDGGMVPSILGMTGALAELSGGPITVLTPTESRRDLIEIPRGVSLVGPLPDFEDWVRRAETAHIHGLWQAQTRRGGAECRRRGIPYIVAAHGMAEPWALRHKRWKKRIYTALVEGKALRGASCLHALTRPEVGHLRALAPGAPVALVPNGVRLEPFEDLPGREVLEEDHPELRGKFALLFYARLHKKKGLDILAEALPGVARDWPELHVLLAGNDEGEWEPFRARADAAGLGDRVTWVGHVGGARAREVWGAADGFILPSHSEGFSMSVLEALACRLPSIITTACHFPELAAAGGAHVVEPTAAGIAGALRALREQSGRERAEMASRGRALVERDYTWSSQARKLASVYRWMASGGSAPGCVFEKGMEA